MKPGWLRRGLELARRWRVCHDLGDYWQRAPGQPRLGCLIRLAAGERIWTITDEELLAAVKAIAEKGPHD